VVRIWEIIPLERIKVFVKPFEVVVNIVEANFVIYQSFMIISRDKYSIYIAIRPLKLASSTNL
jgi:hypothetical protein